MMEVLLIIKKIKIKTILIVMRQNRCYENTLIKFIENTNFLILVRQLLNY